jgi:host factor-I protein
VIGTVGRVGTATGGRCSYLQQVLGDLQLMAETKTGAPNIQDVFLNYARREKLPVTVHLLDGREFDARIKNFDRFALIVEHGGMDHLIFKHAIATIRTPRSVPNYFSSHHP